MLLGLEKSDGNGRSHDIMNDNEERIDDVSVNGLGGNPSSLVISGESRSVSFTAQTRTIYSLDEHISLLSSLLQTLFTWRNPQHTAQRNP